MSGIANVPVHLGKRSYDIMIGSEILESFGSILSQEVTARRVAVVTNDKVWGLHGDKLEESLEAVGIRFKKLLVPDGESAKSLPVAEEIYGALIEGRFERGEPVVAFGGGVVGDFAGFIAATYLRGVPLVHVPTTLLAQVDSSIGGKVAINHPRGKNMVGAFYQPLFVFADVSLLKTLDARDVRNGLAEAIKYAFIWKGGPIGFLENHLEGVLAFEPDVVGRLVTECASIKAKVVEIDEKDKGLRAILNYGHTFGHAIETSSHYAYSHGEAVGIGMHFAALLAAKLGLIDRSAVDRHVALLKRAGLPIRAERLDVEAIIKAMAVDKKREQGESLFVLLEGVGEPVVKAVPEETVIELAVDFV